MGPGAGLPGAPAPWPRSLAGVPGPGPPRPAGSRSAPGARARLRGQEVLDGLRLPPVPGAQEPQAEDHDLGQEGVCGPLQVAQGPGKILRLQGRQHQVAVVAGGQHPRVRHRSRQHLAPQAHQQPQAQHLRPAGPRCPRPPCCPGSPVTPAGPGSARRCGASPPGNRGPGHPEPAPGCRVSDRARRRSRRHMPAAAPRSSRIPVVTWCPVTSWMATSATQPAMPPTRAPFRERSFGAIMPP